MMQRRLLYGVMIVASAAMLMFVAGYVLWRLGLAMLTGIVYFVAGKLMLLVLVALVLLGLAAAIDAVRKDVGAYFNREAMAMRRLASLLVRRNDSRGQLRQQSRQLRYWAQVRQRRLLAANNRKHLRALFKAVDGELRAAKSQLPPRSYRELRKALRGCLGREDVEAMLALRQQLPCR